MSLRIDNGTEYINKDFLSLCEQMGIFVETTAPHSSAQNGVAERLFRTLFGDARAMLIAMAISKGFWPEAVSYACHIRNCVPTAALDGETPWEALTGEKPDVSKFHEFGSKCWVLDQSADRSKLDPVSRVCQFMGFSEGSKAYVCWDPAKHTFVKSRNVIFSVPTRATEFVLPLPGSTPKGESGAGTRERKRGEEKEARVATGSRAPEGQGAAVEGSPGTAGALPEKVSSQARETHQAGSSGGEPETPVPVKAEAPSREETPIRERSARLQTKAPVDYLRLHNPQARCKESHPARTATPYSTYAPATRQTLTNVYHGRTLRPSLRAVRHHVSSGTS